jgi:hypothetical protein
MKVIKLCRIYRSIHIKRFVLFGWLVTYKIISIWNVRYRYLISKIHLRERERERERETDIKYCVFSLFALLSSKQQKLVSSVTKWNQHSLLKRGGTKACQELEYINLHIHNKYNMGYNTLPRDWIIVDGGGGVGLIIKFIGHFNAQIMTTIQKSLSHED